MITIRIALKNIKETFNNFILVPIVIGMPLFQIFIMSMVFDDVDAKLSQTAGQGFCEVVLLNTYNNLSSSQIYIPAVVVMFILITGVISVSSIVTERESNILTRIFTAPLKRSQFLIANLAGFTFSTTAIAIILILLTSLFFNITWGNPLGVVFATLLTVYVAVAMGFVFSGLFKNSKVALGLMNTVVIVMSLLSGGLTSGAGSFGLASKFTLNYWANNAFIGVMEGQPLANLATNLTILGITGTILLLAAIYLYQKEDIYE